MTLSRRVSPVTMRKRGKRRLNQSGVEEGEGQMWSEERSRCKLSPTPCWCWWCWQWRGGGGSLNQKQISTFVHFLYFLDHIDPLNQYIFIFILVKKNHITSAKLQNISIKTITIIAKAENFTFLALWGKISDQFNHGITYETTQHGFYVQNTWQMFQEQVRFEISLKNSQDAILFEVQFCLHIFSSNESYNENETTQHKFGMKMKRNNTTQIWNENEMKQHNTNLECITCGKCFKENWKLKSHSKTHRLRDCPNCKFVGTSSNQLKQYMKIHNLNQCNLCKKVFSIPATLLNHQKNISCVFACSLCPKLLSDKRHRKNHELRVHAGKWEPFFDCHICGKPNASKQSLEVHLTSHTKTGPVFPCLACGKLFKATHLLKTHFKHGHMGQFLQDGKNHHICEHHHLCKMQW